jgi:hypothetical protein
MFENGRLGYFSSATGTFLAIFGPSQILKMSFHYPARPPNFMSLSQIPVIGFVF